METLPTVIKKYGNRRLYDTSGSRYVNLEEIAALVRNGKDVQVLDAKTGEDLTRVILTQIILEDAKGQPSGLPLELLRQLVVATDRVGRDFLMWYLKSAFDAYHKVHDSVQSRLSEVQAAALSPLQMVRNFMQREPAKPYQPSELDQLRERIAELEGRMSQSAPKKPARKKRKPARKKSSAKRRS
jgi:polyhydroxyalkanoate synthesis repressor PhaR